MEGVPGQNLYFSTVTGMVLDEEESYKLHLCLFWLGDVSFKLFAIFKLVGILQVL